jgi:NAD(P)-dependent dehydrogenase (short-subunit alcohol dehydrogenase family)
MNRLQNKIAVITGGSKGMGLATAEQFVAEGAYVYITGRRRPELDAAVTKIGKNITAIQGDASDLAHLDRLYERIAEEKGRLDIVFANAGIGNQMAVLGLITEEQIDQTFNLNVRGLIFTVQKALPLMHERGLDHFECFKHFDQRNRSSKCVRSEQGCGEITFTIVDDRFERPQNSSEYS